jgi:hypothetical protein
LFFFRKNVNPINGFHPFVEIGQVTSDSFFCTPSEEPQMFGVNAVVSKQVGDWHFVLTFELDGVDLAACCFDDGSVLVSDSVFCEHERAVPLSEGGLDCFVDCSAGGFNKSVLGFVDGWVDVTALFDDGPDNGLVSSWTTIAKGATEIKPSEIWGDG